MVGALDIINDQGVCLSLNQISYGLGKPVEPVFIMMRRIAENCNCFEEARAQILKTTPEMPFILTLSSAKERKNAVFEPMGVKICERGAEAGVLTADNVTWGKDIDRSSVATAVRRVRLDNIADMQRILRDPAVMLNCNIYSVIFDFSRNRFYLASGRTPAAKREHRQFTLFPPHVIAKKPEPTSQNEEATFR